MGLTRSRQAHGNVPVVMGQPIAGAANRKQVRLVSLQDGRVRQVSFFQELKRRNVFRVAVAYAVVGWLLVEVASVLFPTFEAPTWVMKVFATVIIMGFPLALFFAWAYELTPEGLKKEKDVDRSQSITHETGRKIDYIIIGLLSVALVFFASTHQLSLIHT